MKLSREFVKCLKHDKEFIGPTGCPDCLRLIRIFPRRKRGRPKTLKCVALGTRAEKSG